LHQKQFKPNKKKEETADKKQGPLENPSLKKKKRGAPVGHTGWARTKPERIDRTMHVPAPTRCPHCRFKTFFPWKIGDVLHFMKIIPPIDILKYVP